MAEIGYVLKQDLLRFLDSNTLNELTGGTNAIGSNPATDGDDTIWEDNSKNAIELVKGYSRHWYDMETEMLSFVEYSATVANTVGQRVASIEVDEKRTLYTCIKAAPAGTALTNTEYYTQEDNRNPMVLEMTCLILVYNISRRINPRQIPEQRQIDYDRVIDQLKDVQKGRIQLDIAERTFDDDEDAYDDSGQTTAFGDFDDTTNDAY